MLSQKFNPLASSTLFTCKLLVALDAHLALLILHKLRAKYLKLVHVTLLLDARICRLMKNMIPNGER